MKQMIYIVAGSLAALAVVVMVVTAGIWPILDTVETGATVEYPEVQPHYYTMEPGGIFEESAAAVDSLARWESIDMEAATHRIEARRSAIFGLGGEIEIRVEPVTEFVSQVHVLSRGGVGKADFGQNARNIKEFFVELDDRLGAVKFEPGDGEREIREDKEREDGEEYDGEARIVDFEEEYD